VAGALLAVFELMLIYKLWLSTRAFEHDLAAFAAADPAADPAADAAAANIPGQRSPNLDKDNYTETAASRG
jgi:hypothetical protein